MSAIRGALRRAGIDSETYVLFISDNGYLLGEHRIPAGKLHAYEPSARVPLLVSGPGMPNRDVDQPVGLHDLASTITGWFGLGPMPESDGVSLVDVAGGAHGQRDLLISGHFDAAPEATYTALRAPEGWKYVEYPNGETELYDLVADPDEVQNLADAPHLALMQAELAARLAGLRTCAGPSCQVTRDDGSVGGPSRLSGSGGSRRVPVGSTR